MSRTLNKEEEVLILYAMHIRGGKGPKGSIIRFIISNKLMQPHADDTEWRQYETKVENDLAWARQSLKDKGQLSMPEHGIWQITELGRERLFRLARRVNGDEDLFSEDFFERFTDTFLQRLKQLGAKLVEQDNIK